MHTCYLPHRPAHNKELSVFFIDKLYVNICTNCIPPTCDEYHTAQEALQTIDFPKHESLLKGNKLQVENALCLQKDFRQ